MSFRIRLIIISSVAVAVAIALGSIVSYLLVRNQLVRELDNTLKYRATLARAGSKVPSGTSTAPCGAGDEPGKGNERFGSIYQIVSDTGKISTGTPPPLPVSAAVTTVAKSEAKPFYSQAKVGGQELRIYTTFYPLHCALQVARPFSQVDKTLTRLAAVLSVLSLGGIGFAAMLGWLVAGAALRPVRRLTEASEEIAQTRDLSRRVKARGRDELARLAKSFDTMLFALDSSLRAQRQLVADASHELRTPLTTIKTNVEVLRRAELSDPERAAILHDVSEQVDELAFLVTDIVELARGVEPSSELEEVRFDLLVAQAVERALRHRPEARFATELEPCVVLGAPSRLDRAIGNLLDNACKWSPPGGEIAVTVKDGELSVRDHGPGIDEEDLPYVFDRFYRSAAARALPGSGLGLAIVRQVAESHGAQVSVELPEGGGTLFRFTLASLDGGS